MEIASGQVRISGAHVFINDLEVSGLKPTAPKPYIRRSAAGGQGVAPGPAGKGAQGRMDRAAYWSDKSHASAYNAKYHGRMATNRHGRPVYQYTDCGRFVHEVVKDDDPNFPAVGTGTMKNYIKENWTHGTPGEGGGPQPGDVLVVHNSKQGHIAIYEGPAPGGGYNVYNASLGGHGPKVSAFKTTFFDTWGRPPK